MTDSVIRPRRTCHTGFVLASGLAIDTRLAGEAAARERILTLFSPGTEVFRVGPFVIGIFASPMRIEAGSAPGAPLVRHGRMHAAAPLDSEEQQALQASGDSVVLIDGGKASATPLDANAREDVSTWIDVSAFAVIGGLRPLGDVTAAPRAQFTAVAAEDLRKSLGIPQIDGMTAKLLRALFSRSPSGAAQAAVSPAAPPPDAQRGSWLARFRDSIANALWSSGLGGLFSRQYGRHLSRLLAMFDANDLDNALRHALPLNAAEELARRAPSPWSSSLWFPWRRKDFSIGSRNRTGATSISLDQRLFQMLQARYRQAFERLAAAGHIEKAAFVLAELLNANEEAVSFLERHGRLRLAAEVAEMRKLPPGLVIRQWFLAGEHERAIQIAQVTGAFSDAVLRLESSHKDQGAALRLLWANKLASAGAYVPAVDVVWPVQEGRKLAFAWIDQAIAVGGATGARMLARKAVWRPEDFPELRDRALTLMRGDGEETRRLAVAFGQELLAGELTDPARLLAVPTIRRLLRGGESDDSKTVVRQLLGASGDSALIADVRSSALKNGAAPEQREPPLHARTEPLEIMRLAADRGAVPIHDAAETADGRLLVAIGEAGALLLSREGKVITRFGEPADSIVMSDHGDRALLLARRGEVFRISRLDLISRRLRPWRDARFDRFAPDFDGLTWFVAREGALYAIDATASDWRHVWKVVEDEALVRQIRRSAVWLSAHFHSIREHGLRSEVWTYELPGLVLRRREGALADGENTARLDAGVGLGMSLAPLGIAADGAFAGWKRMTPPSTGEEGGSAGELIQAHGKMKIAGKPWVELPFVAGSSPGAPCLAEKWAAAADIGRRVVRIQLVDLPGQRPPQDHVSRVRAVIALEMAGSAGIRMQGERMVVFDQCGRLLVLCLKTGAVVREHRLAG